MSNSDNNSLDHLGNRFLSGIGWLGFSKLLGQIFTWTTTIILARILFPEDYGLVGMSGLVVGIIALLGDFGFSDSIVRKKSVNHDELSALYWQFLFIGLVISSLIFWVVAPIGVKVWKEPELLQLIRLSAFPFLINMIGKMPAALLQRKMRFKEYGFILSIAAVMGGTVSIITALMGQGAKSLIYGNIAIASTSCLLLYIREPFVPRVIFRTEDTSMHLRFGALVTIDIYLWWIYSSADSWFASLFLGTELYGIYSIAFLLASMPIEKLAPIINPVALPTFSKLNNRDDLITLYYSLTKNAAYLMAPICVLLFWTAEDLLIGLLSKKWTQAVPVFRVLILLTPIRFLATFNAPLLNSISKPEVRVKNSILGVVLALSSFAVGVQFGLLGLSLAWCVFFPLFYGVAMFTTSRAVGFSYRSFFGQFKSLLVVLLLLSLAIVVLHYALYPALGIIDTDSLLQILIRLSCDSLAASIVFFFFIKYFDQQIYSAILSKILRYKS